MSRLTIASPTTTVTMNVVAFSSPIFQALSSSQTRMRAIHFPIKISQPDIKFTVVFRNEQEFQNFQGFVRAHQQNVLGVQQLLTLNWPERNIHNWTGVIPHFQAGGERRNYMPRADFTVDLVDSFVSTRTDLASRAASWQAIYGGFGLMAGNGFGGSSPANTVYTGPSLAQSGFLGGGANPLAAGYGSVPVGGFVNVPGF